MWKQSSRKSNDGANEREMALGERSKTARNDEQPEDAKSRKRTVLIVLGALLALCLAIGTSNCAASYKQAESIKFPSPEQVKKNAKTDPSANKDKVDEEGQKAEEGVTVEAPGGNAGASNPETSSGSTSSGNGGSTGNGGNSGSSGGSGSSNNGGGSKPQHTHNWVAETTIVHHDAVYETTYIHHDAVKECHSVCNGCHADITGVEESHMEAAMLNGKYECGAWHDEWIIISDAWDEPVQKLVKDAWDETITTGYACSGCGATK